MINIIRVNKIRLFAYHGCLEEEGRIGGQYEVNVVLHTDFMEAARQDDLTQTIDYVLVNRIVHEEMAIRSKLIEDVALRIHTRFKKELQNLHKSSVEIVKLSPPINGDVESVSVILED
ncbi:MAG: folB [Crocinitomicaceae bacterium]|jgi:dihydroneopterin aldolase|nr:folB [Crocinitomicaceae bacterium]